MRDYLLYYYLLAPIVGYLVGSTTFLRPLSRQVSIKLMGALLIVCGVCAILDFTFIIDALDYSVLILLLFLIGYSATQLKKEQNGRYKEIISGIRKLFFLFYLTLPISGYFLLITVMGENNIETVRFVEEDESNHIKHISKGAGYASSGTHIARVYMNLILFEYPIAEFDLGSYDESGYNTYTKINGEDRPISKARFDKENKVLEVFKYDNATRKFQLVKKIN